MEGINSFVGAGVPRLKNIGVLVNKKDYFLPYIEWLVLNDGTLFNVVGYLDNGESVFSTLYPQKRNKYSLDSLSAECDLIISLGYWRIISKDVIDAVPLGILNLHHSYLLKYRGRHSASWAILNNEKTHGSTLHYMTALLDEGPILDSVEVPIYDNDTAYSLFVRTNSAAVDMFVRSVPRALLEVDFSSLLSPDPSHKMYKKRDLVHEIPVSELSDVVSLFRHVRALTFPGSPPPFVCVGGSRICLRLDCEENK